MSPVTTKSKRRTRSAERQATDVHSRRDIETISSMRRTYKFLLRPTSRQATELTRQLALHCEIYNAALEERREAWRMRKKSVSFADQVRQLPDLRVERADVGTLQAHSIQATLRRLDLAFKAFFRRLKNGEAPGYPRFRSVARFDSITYTRERDAPMINGRLRIYGIGHVRVHQHRALPAAAVIKTVTVKRDGHRWFVMLSCDNVPTQLHDRTGAVTGIDLGIVSLLTTSEGEHVANPRHGEASREQLAAAYRAVSRRKRGSRRHAKAARKLAQVHRKARNQRRDTAHKVALDLVRRHDIIVHEALDIQKMTQSASGTVELPGRNVKQKTGLNRAILDAGWGYLLTTLRDKAEWAGREVIAVHPRHTSRRCTQCGYTAQANRVTQAAFRCQSCGHAAHADVNAAINILRAGLALREVAA